MQSIKHIKRSYYIQLCFFTVLVLTFIIALILLVVNRNAFPSYIISFLLITVVSLAELGFLYILIIFLKDLKNVRNNKFEELTGVVVGYKRHRDPDSGQQVNTRAIICEINSNKKIEVCVTEGMTECNKEYKFIFLKHTKIGAIKEEITE